MFYDEIRWPIYQEKMFEGRCSARIERRSQSVPRFGDPYLV